MHDLSRVYRVCGGLPKKTAFVHHCAKFQDVLKASFDIDIATDSVKIL